MPSVDPSIVALDPSVLNRFASSSGDIARYAQVVGISALSVSAPVSREMNKLLFDYQKSLVRQAADFLGWSSDEGRSNADLLQQYKYLKDNNITRETASAAERYSNFMLHDLGPGKIRASSAVEALFYYDQKIDDGSDPLNLHQYIVHMNDDNSTNNLKGFLSDYSGFRSSTEGKEIAFDVTLKISAILGAQIKEVLNNNFGNNFLANLDPIDQGMAITAGYTMGTERLVSLIRKNIEKNGEFIPNFENTDGSEYMMRNNNIYLINDALLGIRVPDNSGESPSLNIPREFLYFGKPIDQCFSEGTLITMAGGDLKPIEKIKIGDEVQAFSASTNKKDDKMITKKVSKLFNNITREIIDLRGLMCTPGHVFLTTVDSTLEITSFESILSILKKDGVIVNDKGYAIRARTGAIVNSIDDIPIAIIYHDPMTNSEKFLCARAGIPVRFPNIDGKFNHELGRKTSLHDWLLNYGGEILLNGTFRSIHGETFDTIDWPAGSTPFDTIEMQNWVVTGPDGQPYTPPWIADLPEEDERANLRVVGEMPGVSLSAL